MMRRVFIHLNKKIRKKLKKEKRKRGYTKIPSFCFNTRRHERRKKGKRKKKLKQKDPN
jgi:hypothetical protein